MRRNRAFVFALLAVSLIMVASVALAEGEGTATPAKDKKAGAVAEKTEAKVAKEEAKPVTATLTYIKDGKGGKLTKEVPYLPRDARSRPWRPPRVR